MSLSDEDVEEESDIVSEEESTEMSLDNFEDKGLVWLEPLSTLLRAVKMDKNT